MPLGNPVRTRYGLLLTALAPVIPQILGSGFNIWYNATVIEPMLTPALRQRFFDTVIAYNALVYPIGIYLWLRRIFSFRDLIHRLQTNIAAQRPPPQQLTQARRRLIHLPWFAAAICGLAWFLCIPVFIGALLQRTEPTGSALAVGSADFVLCLGLHRGHTFIFPGRACESVGIVSGFLS